jgi:hypothetical protein
VLFFGQVAVPGQTAHVQRASYLFLSIPVTVDSKRLWVGCPIVRASDEHCSIVRVLRAQGLPPTSLRFLSSPQSGPCDLTGGADLGACPPAATFLHFISLSAGVLF